MKIFFIWLFRLFGAFYFFLTKKHFSVKITCEDLGLWTPTYPLPLSFGKKSLENVFFSVCLLQSKFCEASKHHEMARYDPPTYVLYVSGHFWMFAVQITECVFSVKCLGLLTHTHPQFRMTRS